MHPMLVLAALLALPPVVAAQTTVPLEVADGGYLYVRVRVADSVDARLLLDTGAGINTISESVLNRLGDRVRDAGTHTGTRHNGETITGRIWSVSSLSLGTMRKENVVVGGFAPRGADGMLSMDFFRDRPFTIDFKGGTLTGETPAHLAEIAAHATSIPIRLSGHGPQLDFFVRLCVGDTLSAEAEFDTGSGFNMLMLQTSYMQRLGITPGGRPVGPMEYYVHSTFLPELHYCAAPAVRTEKQFVGFKAGLIYEALVGSGAFRDRRLTIDIPGKRMLAW